MRWDNDASSFETTCNWLLAGAADWGVFRLEPDGGPSATIKEICAISHRC